MEEYRKNVYSKQGWEQIPRPFDGFQIGFRVEIHVLKLANQFCKMTVVIDY